MREEGKEEKEGQEKRRTKKREEDKEKQGRQRREEDKERDASLHPFTRK